MSLQQFDFTYVIPEFGVIEVEVDDHIDELEKEEVVIKEIEDSYPEAEEIKITGHRKV